MRCLLGLQGTALPDSLKSNEPENPATHRFQFADYLTNRVWPHVPVENPIRLAALRGELACPRVDFTCRNGVVWFRFL